jgi:hypothetical protein
VIGVWYMERKVAGSNLAVDVDFFFIPVSNLSKVFGGMSVRNCNSHLRRNSVQHNVNADHKNLIILLCLA